MKRRLAFWLCGVGVLVCAAGLIYPAFRPISDRYYAVHRTINNAAELIYYCQAYRQNPASDGKYPTTLADLIKPPFDTEFKLSNRVFSDYWDRPLHYAVVMNEKGEPEPYIWADRVIWPNDKEKKRLHLIGAKGTPDGEVEKFGKPE